MVAQQSSDTILASLTGPLRRELGPLAETLAATLDAESLCQLRGHLQACDDASALVADQDRRIPAATTTLPDVSMDRLISHSVVFVLASWGAPGRLVASLLRKLLSGRTIPLPTVEVRKAGIALRLRGAFS